MSYQPNIAYPVIEQTRSNPAHQKLFRILEPLATRINIEVTPEIIPQRKVVTGDHEIDTVLWWNEVCATTTDTAVLDQVMEASQEITLPSKELDTRYLEYLAHSGEPRITSALSSWDFSNIERKVKAARYRIKKSNEALNIFGSYEIAMSPTPPELMLIESTAELPDGDLSSLEKASIFANSVNPGTLSETLDEIRYWDWLRKIRNVLPKSDRGSSLLFKHEDMFDLRISFIFHLLEEIEPVDQEEVIKVARAILPDDLNLDSDSQVKILLHLMGIHPS